METGPPDAGLKARAMDEAPIGVTIADATREDVPLVYVNDAFCDITGYSRADALGRNCRFLQGEESDPDAVEAMREAIAAAESVTVELVNYRKDGTPFWNGVTLAPLENAASEVTHYLGFQEDVTARKEAELEVEREHEALDHLVTRINGLIGDVTDLLMRSSTRSDSEHEIVERIAETPPYTFAWVGERDRVRNVVVPSAWAGDGSVADVEIPVDADDFVARALRSGDLEIETDGPAWTANVPAAQSAAAIPLSYGARSYGVLVVHAANEDGLAGRESVVLEALGRTIGAAIDAGESKRRLTADHVVEMEFSLRDRDVFFVDFATAHDCELTYEGTVPGADGSFSMFFTTDASPDAVSAYANSSEVADADVLSQDGGRTLAVFRVDENPLVGFLADRGMRAQSIEVAADEAKLVVESAAGDGARDAADEFKSRYDDVTLLSYRERDRPPVTNSEFVSAVENRLTGRQLAALQSAFVSGYYESNRSVTGDELAASMGVSRSTFHQHLRAAERKLISEFFAERP